jgi:putative transposase
LNCGFSPRARRRAWQHRGVVFSVIYVIVRHLLGLFMLLVRNDAWKEAELLVLRRENAVLRRQVRRIRYQPADRLWLAALSHLLPDAAGPRSSR